MLIPLLFKVKGIEGWEATLEYYSGISISELEPVAHALLKMLQKPAQEIILNLTLSN